MTVVQRRADQRRRLCAAGLDVFARDGYSATVAAVCEMAGVSTRSFYEIFANREKLLIALYDDATATAQAAVASELDNGGEFVDRVVDAVRAYIEAISQDPRVTSLMVTALAGVCGELDTRREEVQQEWVAAFTAAADTSHSGLVLQGDAMTWVALYGAIQAVVRLTSDTDRTAAYLRATITTGLLAACEAR